MTTAAPRHRLSSAQLTEIAWGRPAPETVQAIYAADDSRHRLLAAHALRESDALDAGATTALLVLDRAQTRDPTTTAEVMRAGWLGPWVSRLLDGSYDRADVAGRLATLAIVAALRTGLSAELTVRFRDGRLHLPGLGTIRLPHIDRRRTGLVRVDNGLTVELPGGTVRVSDDPASWTPLRELTDDGISLVVDDRDPVRDCFGLPPAGPLPEPEFRQWQDLLRKAWQGLRRSAPTTAEQVGHGLRVLVPLAPTPHGADTSVSCADALGAIATTAPVETTAFGLALVHEWSHSLLNGLLGFVSLQKPGSDAMYFAPWRPDPRPLSGLLHGVFAFMSVAETSAALLVRGPRAQRAEMEFALRRQQLAEVLSTLPDDPWLSPQGHRFVAVLRLRCAALFDTPVRRQTTEDALAEVAAQKATWIRRHRAAPA